MQKRSTVVALVALLLIFGYYTWEYFSKRHHKTEQRENEEAEKDRIDLAIQQDIRRTKDLNTNSVPVQRLIQAKNFKDQKLSQLNNNRLATLVPGINWVERGPSNVGGRSRVIWYDLNDVSNGYKKVWAGSVGGGLWYTNDITVASPVWNKINDLFDNIAITSFVQSPSSPNTLYFGTGEGWFNGDAVEGLGIWKSTDGGSNWSQLSYTLNFAYVQDLLIDQNGNLYATVRNRTGSQARGIQKSTDGGTTWTQVLGAPLAGFASGRGCDLELAVNGDIYASIGNFSEGRIYRSSFSVNGVNTGNAGTWTDITPNPTTNSIPAAGDNYDRIEIATAPSNGNVVYAVFEGNGTYNVSNIKQYDASTNTWTNRTVPNYSQGGPYTRSQAWYDLIAAVDPNNANTLYIGGIDVYKSTNNGATWNQVSDWRSIGLPYVHSDIHQIAYAPGSSSRIAIGCDGGIFYSADANLASPNFTEKNSGYNVTQFYGVAIHPTLPNFFLAGAQDNGSQKFTSAGVNSTTEVTGGDGAFCHIDQDNPNIQITAYVYNNYYISTNGGATFSTLYVDPDPNDGSGDFINPTDYDNTANILYACSSEDVDPGPAMNYQFNRYTRITGIGTTNTASLVTLSNSSTTDTITHVAVSPSLSNRVYFGFDNGRIGYVNNANTGTSNTVNFLTATGVAGSVSCIAIDPSNENHILVTYSNYGVNSIWETTNGGTSWTSVEGNLPDMPVRWVMFDPRNSDWALIATELGVWSTDNLNGGSTDWGPTNSGLANVRVDMLQYRATDRTIAAATHGRGLFTATIPISTTPEISFVSSSGSTTEQTTSTDGCRGYTDYPINMVIANAPTGDATVTVSIQGVPVPTATRGIDYEFTTNGNFTSPNNVFVFTNGSTAPKIINLRIYDDAEVEVPETFTLTYSISGTSNAQTGSSNQTYTFTINDNDSAPTGPYAENIWTENWDGTVSGWSTQQAGSGNRNNWVIGTGCTANITGNSAQVARIQGGNTFCGYGTNASTVIMYKQVDATIHSSLQVQFNWRAGGDGTTDYGRLVYSTNGGSSWQNVGGQYFNQATTQSATVNLPASLSNTTFLLGWSFTADNTGGNQALSFGIDDIIVSGTKPGTSIESIVNSSRSVYLGPNADVYLYSSADGELIGRIQNLSSHDYGCTSIQLDRAGTGSSPFWNTNTANYLMNKTFRVIPTNNNPSGQYTITLYFTAAEVAGWQTATGQSWANIQLIKLPSQISNVTPANPEPDGVGTVQVVTPILGMLGTHYTLSYPFSNGFSGFGAGIPGISGTLPMKLLSFTGKLQSENVKLNWSTSFEQNSKGFEIEKSLDGINFKKIGFVAGAGNSNSTRDYSLLDPQRAVEFNYYRLKLVDIDNTFDYSDVVLVKNSFGKQDVYLAGNPITNTINIQFAKTPNGRVAVSIYDMKGSKIYDVTYNNYTQTSLQINSSRKLLAHGVYSVKVETAGKIYDLKAIK
ncbi:MAG TPA: T9SS type A sorting domain-containing protein [Chitinophagaceae bacterium]|nr:T9SS type A sorting domain-containing protein [Chitinophagaceae bacterium]